MNTTEELASIADSSLRDVVKKSKDVIKELLKALILRATQAQYMDKNITRTKGLTVSRDGETKEFDYKLGEKEYRSKNKSKKQVNSGLQKTFVLSEKESIDLFTKTEKQGIKEVVITATKRAEIYKQKTSIKKNMNIKKEQNVGAR